MASSSWDGGRVRAQLRLTSQRLGQLQDRKDSLAHITSNDVATLLRQRNVALARAKVQNLITEDAASNALEILEMHCGVIVERFSELERGIMKLHPSTIEAASSIIYAAPHTESKDLSIVREMLMQRLGPDFSQSAIFNSDGHVSPTIVKCLHHTSTAAEIDEYLMRIARTFQVDWKPQMSLEEKTAVLSELLDESDIMGVVDIAKLRSICASGLPAHPPWLRPRVWKLLLGTIPPTKARWKAEAQKKRDDYYDLVERLLSPISKRPLPVMGFQADDKALLNLFDSLSRVPVYLFSSLDDEPEQFESCPLHACAPAKIRLACAANLDARLQLLHSGTPMQPIPQVNVTPEIRLDVGSPPTSPTEDSFNEVPRKNSSTLLAPQAFRNVACHELHVSALFRLLYVHKCLNPGSHSPHVASLLVPLYSVMNEEADPNELAHSEADTFWLFESLLREISELEEEDGGTLWMKRLGQRLATADPELHEDLQRKGLDPAMPHYSYKWLAPLLTNTLPLSAVLIVWDALIAQPESYRDSNPKLEHLVDVCTAMLVRARSRLLLLGKPGRRSPSLWDDDGGGLSRSPLRAWELGDAFMEGMTLLQRYPVEEAGGVERLIQVAGDLQIQRTSQSNGAYTSTSTIGEKLRNTLWSGFVSQTPSNETETSPVDSDEEEEGNDGSSGEVTDSTLSGQSTASTWATRLGSSVWRGFTNQSAMDIPPSPEASPLPSPRRQDSDTTIHPSNAEPPEAEKPNQAHSHSRTASSFLSPPGTASLWNYAERLKQSDMAAKLSKVSTNVSAKALDAWSARSAPPIDAPIFDQQQKKATQFTPVGRSLSEQFGEGDRRGSLPNINRTSVYSPPPRPVYFKPPRDSRTFSPSEASQFSFPDSPDSATSAQSAPVQGTPSHGRMGSISMQRLQSWSQNLVSKPAKSAPRPLLLNPTSLVTPSPGIGISRSENSTPRPDQGEWTDIMERRVVSPRSRDSQSSMSSVQSASVTSPKTMDGGGWDSDTSISRKVPLNRASISPVAPLSRLSRYNKSRSYSRIERTKANTADSEAESAQFATMPTHVEEERRSVRGWEQILPDSPSTYTSSPPPRTPVSSVAQAMVKVNNSERQRGSMVLSEPSGSGGTLDLPLELQQNMRKKSSVPIAVTTVDDVDTSDSSLPPPSPSIKPTSRVRSKRYGAPLASLRIRDSVGPLSFSPSNKGLSPSSLTAPELFDGSDIDLAPTPRAVAFPTTSPTSPRRQRKVSTEGHERRSRKVSAEKHHKRAKSASEDGDDEGYDELLSAYESEESRDDHWVEIR